MRYTSSLLFLFAASFFTSCGPAGEGSEQAPDEDSIAIPDSGPQTSGVALLAGCYQMIIKEDTAGLELEINGDTVTGSLYYHWREKDHNDGSIKGTFSDSVILADYTFRSEGITSVREVIFKIKGDTLYSGYGDILTGGDTVKFKDRRLIDYDMKNPFIKVNCE